MSWYVSRDLRLLRLLSYTQNGDAACETAPFIGTIKSVLRRKYRLLVHIVNNNRKKHILNIAKCYVSAM